MVSKSKIIYKDDIPYRVTLEVSKLDEGVIQNIKNKSENKKLLIEASFKLDKIIEPIQNKICHKYGIDKIIDNLGIKETYVGYIGKDILDPKNSNFGMLYSYIYLLDKYHFDNNGKTSDGKTYNQIFNKYKKAAKELEDELNRNKEFNQIATLKDISVIGNVNTRNLNLGNNMKRVLGAMSNQIYTRIYVKNLKH